MRITSFKTISVAVILISLFSSVLSAQESGESQRDYVKRLVQYSRWQDILRTKPEVSYDEFKPDSTMISSWRIQRIQEIESADHGSMVRYVLAKSDDIGKAEEILLVSVTRCSSRADAAEGLIDHLLGVQRPDFRLIEEDNLLIGDLAVHIPDKPESAIFFFRGNVLISVENSGKKAAADLRNLAQTLDENLREKRKK